MSTQSSVLDTDTRKSLVEKIADAIVDLPSEILKDVVVGGLPNLLTSTDVELIQLYKEFVLDPCEGELDWLPEWDDLTKLVADAEAQLEMHRMLAGETVRK